MTLFYMSFVLEIYVIPYVATFNVHYYFILQNGQKCAMYCWKMPILYVFSTYIFDTHIQRTSLIGTEGQMYINHLLLYGVQLIFVQQLFLL